MQKFDTTVWLILPFCSPKTQAVRDVDKLLAAAYEERAKARAQGKPFADASALHGRFPRELPESLRPRPGGCSSSWVVGVTMGCSLS